MLSRHRSFEHADDDFIDPEDGPPEADDGSDPPSPLLLELRDPDAPPPDWNLARDPVPDMVRVAGPGSDTEFHVFARSTAVG